MRDVRVFSSLVEVVVCSILSGMLLILVYIIYLLVRLTYGSS